MLFGIIFYILSTECTITVALVTVLKWRKYIFIESAQQSQILFVMLIIVNCVGIDDQRKTFWINIIKNILRMFFHPMNIMAFDNSHDWTLVKIYHNYLWCRSISVETTVSYTIVFTLILLHTLKHTWRI